MNFRISEDRRTLTLTATPEEREELVEFREDYEDRGSTWIETEACERMLANSELRWIDPSDTGDPLADAPMLGIVGGDDTMIGPHENLPPNAHGRVYVGTWGSTPEAKYVPILERWGYMHYQIRSFISDLVETGEAEFVDRN